MLTEIYAPPFRGYRDHPARSPAILLGFAASTLILAATSFSCLPATLRRCQVRPRHVVRVAMYSLAIVPVLACWYVWRMVSVSGQPALIAPLFWPVMVWLPLFAMVWWSAACRQYLKLPQAWLVGVTVVAIAWMASFALGYYLIPEFQRLVLGWS